MNAITRTNARSSTRRPSASSSTAARSPARAGETHHRGRQAPRRRDPAPLLQGRPATPVGNCRACMVEIKGERVLAPRAAARRRRAWRSRPTASARCKSQKLVLELLLSDMPETALHAPQRARPLGRASSASASRASRRARRSAPDLSHPAIAVNLDACIQCTRCVRACRDEQVNDVIGLRLPRRAREDRVRHGRPDGRVHLRGLRRMRAGLPHRRADAGARRRRWRCPTSRSTRSARTAASAASSPTTSRTTRSSTSTAATARPTTAGCASRAATASTTRTIRSA